MNLRALLTLLLAAFVLALSSQAKADDPTPYAAPTSEVIQPGFGYQIVLADALAVATSIAILNSDRGSGSVAAWVIPFATFSPVVHILHDDVRRGIASLGLHAGAPVALGLAGAILDLATCSKDEWLCGAGGLAMGYIGGMIAATVIDAAGLAGPRRTPRPNTYSLAPSFGRTREGATTFVIAGTL